MRNSIQRLQYIYQVVPAFYVQMLNTKKQPSNQVSLGESDSTLSLLSDPKRKNQNISVIKFTKAGLNVSLNLLLESLPNIISLYFLGQYSSVEVQSTFGIVLVFSICLGYGIFEGVAAGLQSFLTSMHPSLTAVIYQRTLVVCTFMMVPIVLTIWVSKSFLFPLIFSETAQMAGWMAIASTISIFFNGLYLVSRSYMNAKQSFNNQFKSTLIAAGVHLVACIFFLEYCEFLVYGTILAKIVTDIFNLNLFLRLININNLIRLEVFQTMRHNQIFPLARKLMERGLVLSLEIIAYQTFAFQTLSLAFNEMSTHVIATNIHNFGYYIYIGISVVTYINISKYLLNNKRTSISYIKYGAALMILAAIGCIAFLLFADWKTLFTNDVAVMSLLTALLPFLVCYMALDSLQVFVSAVSRSLGEHHSAFRHFVISFFVFGQPLCFFLKASRPEGGIKNIWISMLTANLIYVLWQGSILLKVDLKTAARKIEDELDEEESTRDSFMEVYYPELLLEYNIKSSHEASDQIQLKEFQPRTYSI